MDLLNLKPNKITSGTLGKHFLVYGPPSSRKTTVASNFSKPLLLATEIGYSFIEGVKAYDIDSWYTFRQVIQQLKKQEVKDMYDTIVIDTVTLLSEQCVTYVCNSLGVESLGDAPWGSGWKMYREEMSKTFNLIAQLGYGVVFISHSKEEREDDGTLVAAGPNFDGTTLRVINPLVDFILFLNKEEDNEGNPTVFAYTGISTSILTKSRVRGLKPKIEFTFENLDSAITEAISGLKIEITDKIEKTEVVKRPLDELVNTISTLGAKAAELKLLDAAEEILSRSLKGVSLGEVSERHYDSLLAVELGLKDLIGEV